MRRLLAVVALALLGAAAPASADASRLVVAYEATALDRAAGVEAAVGARLVDTIAPLGLRVVEVEPARAATALADLRARPEVRFAERDARVEAQDVVPNDALWSHQWSLARAGVPRAWGLSTGAHSVVVAVLDTGVDGTHPDLQGKLVPGHDVVNGDGEPEDDNGHGTAVAGIVGAATNNGVGVAGACWLCLVMPVKVLDGKGTGNDSQVAAGIVWAVDHGARVVNMSLGSPGASGTLAAAVDYARARGVLLVAAAGNDGTTTPTYPAAFPDVVSVAATDEADALYGWSNRGDWVGFAAPGTSASTWPGGEYRWFAGTSSAAPVVAGIAGLALAAAPAATAGDVHRAFVATAIPVAGIARGRIDAFAALAHLGAVAPAAAAPPAPAAAPAVAAPAARRTPAVRQPRVVDVQIGPQRTTRGVRVHVAGGLTTFAVKAPRGVRLSAVLRGPTGRAVARAAGVTRLSLTRRLRAGVYRFVVTAEPRRATRFRVSVTAA